MKKEEKEKLEKLFDEVEDWEEKFVLCQDLIKNTKKRNETLPEVI